MIFSNEINTQLEHSIRENISEMDEGGILEQFFEKFESLFNSQLEGSLLIIMKL